MADNVIIMGAAGRDFHNFLVYFKDNPNYTVICFTAEQVPGIEKRIFPGKLSGNNYPFGIPIYPESELPDLIEKFDATVVCLSYSDLSHEETMHKASIALANGADFLLLGPEHTQLISNRTVIAITAIRTGCGKSQTSRKIGQYLGQLGSRVVAVRHPMPYGDLVKQEVQRFAHYDDLEKNECTIEEREEYEPWIEMDIPIYAGIDYKKILERIETEADIIIWDGGNNDQPFYKPDLHIVVTDPHRPGHELLYHPGEANFRNADIIIINKVDSASSQGIETIKENAKKYNPSATVFLAKSKLIPNKKVDLSGKRVIIVGDGPTITHGNMRFGAGTIFAKQQKAEIVDPKTCAVGMLRKTLEKFSHLTEGTELPAMGYSKEEIADLERSVNKAQADFIIDGTPVDLAKIIKTNKEMLDISYELELLEEKKFIEELTRVKNLIRT